MSSPCKIVTLTDEQRDLFRKLRDEEIAAKKAFADFQSEFKKRNEPPTRRYVPFEKVELEFLDSDHKVGGTVHAYFTKEIE